MEQHPGDVQAMIGSEDPVSLKSWFHRLMLAHRSVVATDSGALLPLQRFELFRTEESTGSDHRWGRSPPSLCRRLTSKAEHMLRHPRSTRYFMWAHVVWCARSMWVRIPSCFFFSTNRTGSHLRQGTGGSGRALGGVHLRHHPPKMGGL